MASTKEVVRAVTELAEPIVQELGLALWDVQFKKEGSSHFLRIFLDRADGSVSIDDCEAVSRRLSDELDRADPIDIAYYLEVSSAGLDRELYRPGDFERFLGETVEVRLYRPRDGEKVFIGELLGYANGTVTILRDGAEETFQKEEYAIVRLYPTF